MTRLGPAERTRSTGLPSATSVSGAGSWSRTVSRGLASSLARDVTLDEPGGLQLVARVPAGETHERGHGHGLGSRREEEGHLAAGVDLAAGLGVGAQGVARGDVVVGTGLRVGHDEAGVLQGADGVGLGQVADVGHRDPAGTGGEDQVDGAALGHLGVGRGLLVQDGVARAGILLARDVTLDEPGGLQLVARVPAGETHERGHGHGLGSRREEEGHLAAGVDLAAGLGVGAQGVARGDVVVGTGLRVGHDEAGVLQGADGVGLGQVADVGHRDPAGTGGEDQVDGAALGHLGVGRGLLVQDGVARAGILAAGDVTLDEASRGEGIACIGPAETGQLGHG